MKKLILPLIAVGIWIYALNLRNSTFENIDSSENNGSIIFQKSSFQTFTNDIVCRSRAILHNLGKSKTSAAQD